MRQRSHAPVRAALAALVGFAFLSFAAPANAVDCTAIPPPSICQPPPEADLVCVSKITDTAVLLENQTKEVIYTIEVRNDGPDEATGVTITDIPPKEYAAQRVFLRRISIVHW